MGTNQVATTRRANLQLLINQKTGGNVTAFAREIGMRQPTLQDMLDARKSFGEKVARSLEQKLGIEAGALDRESPVDMPPIPRGQKHIPAIVRLVQFDNPASMGLGRPQADYDTVVGHLPLARDWVGSNLRAATSVENLAIITAYGDSMKPTFDDGDVLIVDRGVNEVRVDRIYVLALKDELYIKRVQRHPNGTISMISDNKKYKPITVTDRDKQKFSVLGRVLWAWNGRKL